MDARRALTAQDEPPDRFDRRLVAASLLVMVLLTAWFRVELAVRDSEFDTRSPDGLLKSDPALLYSLLERIVEAGGSIPADFAHDTRLEHPDTIDVATRFPLAMLQVTAWAHILLGRSVGLHVTATEVAALAMALALVGVYLLAREVSGSRGLGLLAALLAAATPAIHRTVGFVLVDEDAFWPLFALHLGLAARAVRVRSPTSLLFAGVSAAAALATWHAASFFLALEALVLFVGFAWKGTNPLAVHGGLLVAIPLVVAAIAVPFLRATDAVYALPVAVAVGLAVAGRLRVARVARAVGIGLTLTVVAIGVSVAEGAHAHVFALLVAKIEHLGLRPPSAEGLTADVRLMWQGPFETPGFVHAASILSLAGVLGLAAAIRTLVRRAANGTANGAGRGPERGAEYALIALFAISLLAAWLAERALVLPALLAPALAAAASSRLRCGAWILGAAVCIQIALSGAWAANYSNPWYHAPIQRQTEIRWLLDAVAEHVPPDEAIAADFMSGPAILAKTGHAIVVSPKWEAREPRRRAAEFLDAFHHDSPEEFRRLLVDRYRVRWLVVDRFTLQYLARWSAGLPPDSFDPLPGTAAAALLAQDDAALRAIPGYELVARSPATIRMASGQPSDFYRLFRLAE